VLNRKISLLYIVDTLSVANSYVKSHWTTSVTILLSLATLQGCTQHTHQASWIAFYRATLCVIAVLG